MRIAVLLFLLFTFCFSSHAQSPETISAADILHRMKKLRVSGSVLYIAAHPDDENTRLLAYLANERKYRTGYLSITRGDGGQNLVGDEQGIELGLIRTQELLAARRIDGAEQFFTSAYDFGYSKSPEEALKIWSHQKILSEVVYVIRKFKPDIIITRFPTTGEGGHGHHTASAILAGEAFDAAGDPSKFPEQIKNGLQVWQAKRLLWNTFNFGSTNTQRDDQFKLDVGQYNPLLGRSYGEMAAISRSQHKSQGFGVPSQRGSVNEYFETIRGPKPVHDIMEGIETGWERLSSKTGGKIVNEMINAFDPEHPENSVPALIRLYAELKKSNDGYWPEYKLGQISKLVEACSGFYIEAVTTKQLHVIGDSMKITVNVNNRLGANFTALRVSAMGREWRIDNLSANENRNKLLDLYIPATTEPSQPYWIEKGLSNGSFSIDDNKLTGLAERENMVLTCVLSAGETDLVFTKPVRYKHTDPVKGELFMPVQLVQPVLIQASPSLVLFRNDDAGLEKQIRFSVQANIPVDEGIVFSAYDGRKDYPVQSVDSTMSASEKKVISFTLNSDMLAKNSRDFFSGKLSSPGLNKTQYHALRKISYDHIPDIYYHFVDRVTVLRLDLKTVGKTIGYIAGAGDKVPDVLEQMGYKVAILKESDISMPGLAKFDAIVTGIRAYNIHEWLSDSYETLMEYVQQGGVLVAQYNTNSSIGPMKAKISPFPFSITRNRITDETTPVSFLKPGHQVMNYPNKITEKDFEGWVQERSVYHGEQTGNNFQAILGMKDPGEKQHDGSLLVAEYGKGRFIYTGLSFFRQLPAGVAGAYRLFANLLAAPVSGYESK